MDKTALRLHLRQIRREVTTKPELSKKIISKLGTIPSFKKAKNILLYWSNENDVDTHELIKKLQLKGATIYLPFVRTLDIGRVSNVDKLKVDKYGICVPDDKIPKTDYPALDLIIVPGLGFDRKGARIGHGYGWYDKFLTQVDYELPRIGLCFSALLVGSIPTLSHDQLIDYIVTEKEVVITHARKKPKSIG